MSVGNLETKMLWQNHFEGVVSSIAVNNRKLLGYVCFLIMSASREVFCI